MQLSIARECLHEPQLFNHFSDGRAMTTTLLIGFVYGNVSSYVPVHQIFNNTPNYFPVAVFELTLTYLRAVRSRVGLFPQPLSLFQVFGSICPPLPVFCAL